MNFQSGLTTYRYWSSQNEVFSSHTKKVDQAKLKLGLLRMRPDYSALESSLETDGIAVIGAARAQNSAKVGLDDRGREHRSLASLYRVVVPTRKAQ